MSTYTARPCSVPQPVKTVGVASFVVLRQLGFQDVQYDEAAGVVRGHSREAVVMLRVWGLDDRYTNIQATSTVTEYASNNVGANRRLADQLGEEVAEVAAQFATGQLDPTTALDVVRHLDGMPRG